MNRSRLLFVLDATLLLAVAFLQEPRRTSLAGHEWLGVGFAALLVVHVVVNWSWIVTTVGRVRGAESRRARINASLNGLLFVLMVVTVFSGVASSEVVLPLTGLPSSDLAAWREVHSFFAGFALGVVGLHLALNWDWIAGVARKGVTWRPRPTAAR